MPDNSQMNTQGYQQQDFPMPDNSQMNTQGYQQQDFPMPGNGSGTDGTGFTG